MKIPGLAIHGGSGTAPSHIKDKKVAKIYLDALKEALEAGFTLLKRDYSALETVARIVSVLEDCELYNAGRGSVYTADGEHEMDAAIMDGKTLEAGAIAGIKGIKNPVRLAKDILQHTPFVFLSGSKAMAFAQQQGYKIYPPSYFHTQYRYDQWQEVKGSKEVKLDHSDGNSTFGTVGAVAVDSNGNLAAATSTGGMTNKRWGRVGDSPLIGAGTYANNKTCAVSCTGHGEYFIRGVVAYDVSCKIEYGGMSLEEATNDVIHKKLKEKSGEGGLISIDSKGNIYMPFNTEGMYRGMMNDEGFFTKII